MVLLIIVAIILFFFCVIFSTFLPWELIVIFLLWLAYKILKPIVVIVFKALVGFFQMLILGIGGIILYFEYFFKD